MKNADLERVVDLFLKAAPLGLRLEDVEAHDLETEAVKPMGWEAKQNLRDNGATEEEIDFLKTRRVELNAFTADGLVAWIEHKLREQGIKKVVPGDDTLETAYRRAVEAKYFREHSRPILTQAAKHAAAVTIPTDLRKQVSRKLDSDPEPPWDRAIWDVVQGADE